jgi:pimeloyl-ACP methyl ester carboxylesterase
VLGVDRAAVLGLSLGGGLALDVTLAHQDRIWALVHVAAGVTGMPVDLYTAGAEPRPRDPAQERLEQVTVPTLVIVPAHGPPAQRAVGATVAHRVPGAQLVEIDSDHYLTLRHPEQVTAAIESFLSASTPSTSSGR